MSQITADYLKDAFEVAGVPIPDEEAVDVIVHELNTAVAELSVGAVSGGNYYNCGADRKLFDEVSDALERSLARELRHQDCPECRGCGYIGQEPRQRCPSCDGYGVKRKFRTYIW